MSRIVICIRTATVPVTHVPSAITSCNDCGQSVWLDKQHAMEDGDTIVCTTCLPQRAKTWQEVMDGKFEATPSTPPEMEQGARDILSAFRAAGELLMTAIETQRGKGKS